MSHKKQRRMKRIILMVLALAVLGFLVKPITHLSRTFSRDKGHVLEGIPPATVMMPAA